MTARLGRLLGVGPGRERRVHAVAPPDGRPALDPDPGAPRDAQDVEPRPRDARLRADDLRDLPHPERHPLVDPRLQQRARRLGPPRLSLPPRPRLLWGSPLAG